MNYLLGLHGFPWITIRIEQREKFFRSLETAQCDGDIRPFAQFILSFT